MENKKIILFDWGNVMMNAEFGSYTIMDVNRDVADEVGIPEELLHKLVKSDGLWTLSGRALSEFLGLYMSAGTVARFKEVWQKHMERVPWFDDVLGIMDSLNSCGYPNLELGVLSVCSELDRALIKKKAGRYAKYYFLSYSMGFVKPDKRIYPLVETVLDTRGADILYFDDLSSSTKEASKHGWNAVCTDGRHADFIRDRCSSFLGQDLKPNAHFKISRWMTEIHPRKVVQKKTALLF